MTVEKETRRGRTMTKVKAANRLINRYFTRAGHSPYDMVEWKKCDSAIYQPNGEVVFSMKGVEAPENFSQLAVDIAVSKYFRKAGAPKTGCETSVRQMVYRVTRTVAQFGLDFGYFKDADEMKTFEDELAYLLLTQRGSFNSPVWFNLGLHHVYGISGSGGNFYWDFKKKTVVQSTNSYERPQCSACFIQSVNDDLMSIFNLIKNEARVFKYGSGSGTNFSLIRGKMEKLSGGGTSSGLMSFLEVFDRAAGATKSGGTTRRAAKMVILNADHPEIRDFINWKVKEEAKVGALIASGYDSDFNGEAYKTVSGQNGNNSVRVNDAFMKAVESDGLWETKYRTDSKVNEKFKARDLFNELAEAAWKCADPGLQFHDTINKWHTCKASGDINASNPCSEFMFIDDSACNLSSLNLMKFVKNGGALDVPAFKQAVKLFITAQEIIVDASSYPTAEIARNSHLFRPLGIGYANLGALLMVKGLPYDSDEARAFSAAVTSLMTGFAYEVSAGIAANMGAFEEYEKNKKPMLEVIHMHMDESRRIDKSALSKDDQNLYVEALDAWRKALDAGEKHGYRNAQVSLLAPTGTIGFLMDCDTTGIEPDYALVKYKKLAGGGFLKIINASVPQALKKLGYDEVQINDIIAYVQGTQTLIGAPHINHKTLAEKGLTREEIARAEKALPSAMELSSAFSPSIVGAALYERIGLPLEKWGEILTRLGFDEKQIAEAEDAICGVGTIEGAPGLKKEHLPVFDCANPNGRKGVRFIEPMGHVRMMAAVQPFLSGAISKTVNLPKTASVEDVKKIFMDSWKLGLKAVAVYRDGSKHSQPLSSDKKADAASRTASDYEAEIADLKAKLAETEAKLAAANAVLAAPKAERRRLPTKRKGITQEVKIGGQKLFIRTGEYDDGSLGEIFLDMHKEGATFRSIMNMFAIAVSLGLQYGVPLEDFVDMFVFTRFEPSGMVNHPNIKSTTSIVDFIFRFLALEYLGRTDFVQVPPMIALMEKKSGDAAHSPNKPALVQTPPASQKAAAVKSEAKTVSAADTKAARGSEGNASANSREADAKTGLQGVNAQLGKLMGDAPMCNICGNLTLRNGTCYKCIVCGNSMGCS